MVRCAAICFAFLALTAQGAMGQGVSPLPGTQTSPLGGASSPVGGVPQAPVGHRQPTPSDLPPAVQKEEEPGAKTWPATQPQGHAQPQTKTQAKTKSQIKTESQTGLQPQAQPQKPSRSQSRTAQGRGGGGGPPTLHVGPSCEAAGRGAVVLGRNKEACMADENAALSTLKQNWAKYAANDKTLCIGMESTGGPASYVELLSCLEINRDAREIQSADPLEADLSSSSSTTTGAASVDSPRHRRRR
jgi:hypothetical protein